MDLYNAVSPDSMKQAYEVANQASIDDGAGPLKLELTRKQKLEAKEATLEKLEWGEEG